MRGYFFHRAIRRSLVQFLDLFRTIYIARYNNDGYATKIIRVPLSFGPKEKSFMWQKSEGKKTDEILPLMAANVTSIDFDSSRMANREQNIVISRDLSAKSLKMFKNAIPYNIGMNLNIWTLHIVDVDQILEQILPFFAPHNFIRVVFPELEATMDIKVILNNATPDLSEDMAEEDWRVIKWTIAFTMQTYVMRPLIISTTTGISSSGSFDDYEEIPPSASGSLPGLGFNMGSGGVSIMSSGIVDKILTRFFMNDVAWEERGTETVFTSGADTPAAVSLMLEGLGYDEDAHIMYQYERYDNNKS